MFEDGGGGLMLMLAIPDGPGDDGRLRLLVSSVTEAALEQWGNVEPSGFSLEGASGALPFRDETFDAVDVRLHTITGEVEAALVEVARVARRGGLVRIEVSNSPNVDHRQVSGELVQLAMRYLRIRDAGDTSNGFFVFAEGTIRGDSKGRRPSRAQRLERDRWKLKSRLALSEWKLESMRERRWWRLGAVLGSIRSRKVGLGRGIRDLMDVIRGPSTLPPRPEPLPAPGIYRGPGSVDTLTLPRIVGAAPVPTRLMPVAVLLSVSDERRYEHEWHSIPLRPDSWREVVAQDRPELLFAASNAIGEEWLTPMSGEGRSPLDQLLASLRETEVPTAYWDKGVLGATEDRAALASRFDFVFKRPGSDLDVHRVPDGDDRSLLLDDSVQPRIHNPIAIGKRRGVFEFRISRSVGPGTDIDPVMRAAKQLGLKALRMGDSSHEDEVEDDDKSKLTYQAGVDGVIELGFQEAAQAPKKFDVAVFGARDESRASRSALLEIAATNTPIIASSAGASADSGIPVLEMEDERSALHAMRTFMRSEEIRSRVAHPALRAVLATETTSDRVDDILRTIGLPTRRSPTLTMMIPTNRPHQLSEIFANLGRQTYPELNVVLALHGIEIDEGRIRDLADRYGIDDVTVVPVEPSIVLGDVFNRGFAEASGDFIGKMDDDDFYGPEYASDLMAAFSYAEAEIVGKWAHYAYLEGSDATVLRYPEGEHSYQSVVAISTLIMKREVLEEVRFPRMPVGSGSVFLRNVGALGARVYSADRFNYVYQRSSGTDDHTWSFSDFEITSRSDFVCRGKNLDHVLV